MRTRPLIVGKIALQVRRNDLWFHTINVVQALASDGAHQPFRKGILPGGSRHRKNFLHAHVSGHGREVFSVDGISIAQHISRRLVPGKCFPHLLHGPLLCGVLRHPEVHHPASLENTRTSEFSRQSEPRCSGKLTLGESDGRTSTPKAAVAVQSPTPLSELDCPPRAESGVAPGMGRRGLALGSFSHGIWAAERSHRARATATLL